VITPDNPAYVDRVLERLQGMRRVRDGWEALCPGRDHNQDGDQHASLRVALGCDGRVLITCRVGCPIDSILDATGLEWDDLFCPAGESPAQATASDGSGASAGPPDEAAADLRDRAYRALLGQLPFSEDHRKNLCSRGLPDPEIERRGYGSLRNVDRGRAAKAVREEFGDAVLAIPGFVQGPHGVTLHGNATGIVIPVRDANGRVRALKIRREGEPKYVYLTGGDEGPSPGSPVHVPFGVVAPAAVVRLTEGELKADVCTVLDGTPTVGVPGVTQWRHAVPLIKGLGASTVVLAYDAPDVHTKPPVYEQARAVWQHLTGEGFEVELEDWHSALQGT
jgi:hypothetical protein